VVEKKGLSWGRLSVPLGPGGPVQPSFTNVLTVRQPLLPPPERFLFTARCHCDDKFVIDMRKLFIAATSRGGEHKSFQGKQQRLPKRQLITK